MKYSQCLLMKWSDGFLFTVAWIPEKFAIRDKIIKIKDDDNEWSDGWEVKEIYTRHESAFILQHERDFARQRKASDI